MTDYDRPLVERLLPAVWDGESAYGMTNPTAPDPDMPRAHADPAHAGTLYAHIADIRIGWAKAPLKGNERKALILRYGLDMTERGAVPRTAPLFVKASAAERPPFALRTPNGRSPNAKASPGKP
jgi:hypothetical protein